ncbi:MAG: type II secretion system F family protein [candidate division WWE3 bacterium]|nr:type II secretion system F family protein [candidate division WWE3 bacterium]
MALYTYKAREISSGHERKGLVEANSQPSALTLLRNQGLLIISMTEKKEADDIFKFANKFFNKASGKDIYNFTRQLNTMISSGLPLVSAIRTLQGQTSSKYFKELLDSVVRDIEGGSQLSKALEKYPTSFDKLYLSLLRAGEVSGTLDKVLDRLSVNLEKSREFKGKLTGAMIYPIVIMVMMTGVVGVMMIFVMPKLGEMFTSMNVDLPITTKIMFGASHFVAGYWWAIIIAGGAFAYGFRAFKKTPFGKHFLDVLIFKLPIFGSIVKMSQLAQFTRNLGVLIGSGVPIIDSLKITKDSLSNTLLRDTIDKSIGSVGRGMPLSQIIASDSNYPKLVSQMLQVGEETGKIDKVLLDIAAYFESETDFAVKNLSSAMEPLIMVILGAGVGVLIFSIITPIYKLTTSF